MKFLVIILLLFQIKSDLLDKLDYIISNGKGEQTQNSKNEISIDESIKLMLNDKTIIHKNLEPGISIVSNDQQNTQIASNEAFLPAYFMKSNSFNITSNDSPNLQVSNPTATSIQDIDPYEFTSKLKKFKDQEEQEKQEENDGEEDIEAFQQNKNELLAKSTIRKDSVIFDHIFINGNGEKFSNDWGYDTINNEFLVPDEIQKEDDITKMMRILSILESLKFNTTKSVSNFRNPPILHGLNTKSKLIESKIFKKINHPEFEHPHVKIRSPPNFLY